MIVLLILTAILVVGYVTFQYTFVRRPVGDPNTREGRERQGWVKYADAIESARQWMSTQEVKPMQVMSYDGKRLYGRFIPCENAKGTVIFFHGYRSHYQVDFSVSMPYYHDLGYHMLFCDQRAHGLSQGRYITFGVKERLDVLSWVTYLSCGLGQEHPIFLSGLSMGAATVLMAADMEFPANIRGIIADCGFTSPGDILRELVKRRYHLPPKPVVWFLNLYARVLAGFGVDEWSTEMALKNARYPIFLAHGTGDDFVPHWMSERAFAACTGEKQLELFEGAGHGTSFLKDRPRYERELEGFLERNL